VRDGKRNNFGNKYFLFFLGNAKGAKNVILGAPFLKEQMDFTWRNFLLTREFSDGDEAKISDGVINELAAKSAALSLEDKVVQDEATVEDINMTPEDLPRSMLATNDLMDDGGVEESKVSQVPRDLESESSSAPVGRETQILNRLGSKVVNPAVYILNRLGNKVMEERPEDTVAPVLPHEDHTRKVYLSRSDISDRDRLVRIDDSDEYDDMMESDY
jgi:hypothetical protein